MSPLCYGQILCGHIWSEARCGAARHVIQTDDNIELDTGKLFRLLAEPGHSWGDLITCPTLTTGAKVGTADTGAEC